MQAINNWKVIKLWCCRIFGAFVFLQLCVSWIIMCLHFSFSNITYSINIHKHLKVKWQFPVFQAAVLLCAFKLHFSDGTVAEHQPCVPSHEVKAARTRTEPVCLNKTSQTNFMHLLDSLYMWNFIFSNCLIILAWFKWLLYNYSLLFHVLLQHVHKILINSCFSGGMFSSSWLPKYIRSRQHTGVCWNKTHHLPRGCVWLLGVPLEQRCRSSADSVSECLHIFLGVPSHPSLMSARSKLSALPWTSAEPRVAPLSCHRSLRQTRGITRWVVKPEPRLGRR